MGHPWQFRPLRLEKKAYWGVSGRIFPALNQRHKEETPLLTLGFVLLFLIPLGIRLDYLSEIFCLFVS